MQNAAATTATSHIILSEGLLNRLRWIAEWVDGPPEASDEIDGWDHADLVSSVVEAINVARLVLDKVQPHALIEIDTATWVDGTWVDGPWIVESTDEELSAAKTAALQTVGLTFDQLAARAAAEDFQTDAERRVWAAVRP